MKKFLSIVILLAMFIIMTGCNDDSPAASQTVFVPTTTQRKYYSPAPPQPLHFNSLEEAKEFIVSEPNLSKYNDEWQEAYKQMIAKFRKEGFFPYVKVDGGQESRSVCLHPQVDVEDIGVNHAYNYNDNSFVVFIYFVNECLEDEAKSGIVEYLNTKFTSNLTDYKEISPVFNGQKVNAVFRSLSTGATQTLFILNNEFFVNVQSKATEAEALDFIEHMSIEKFSLA